jgi:hypothetical protein
MAAHSDKQLEQLWIKYQFDIAGLRGALGPLFNVAFHARQAHTFNIGEGPETRAVHATMGPSPGEPNGIPDGHAVMTGPTYGARAASVMAASTILMTFDSAIQELATRLGSGRGANMQAGDRIANMARTLSEPASTLVWAAVNNIRHVDEWHASAATYSDPRSQGDIDLRERQNRSMVPLANVLGCKLPITDNRVRGSSASRGTAKRPGFVRPGRAARPPHWTGRRPARRPRGRTHRRHHPIDDSVRAS